MKKDGQACESMIVTITVLLGVCLSIIPLGLTHTHAEIYQWTDKNGTVHFSDNPVRGRERLEQLRSQRRPLPPRKEAEQRELSRSVSPPAGVLRRAKWMRVAKVIDGDTITLATGEKVRLLGIDTPETKHPKKVPDPCGPQATNVTRELLSGKKVTLEFDMERKDRYGRLLAHVFTRSTFVNAELIRRGYARVSTYRPNLKYRDFFLSLQSEAKKEDRGMWGEC